MRYKAAWKKLREQLDRDVEHGSASVAFQARQYRDLMKELERTPS